jgi:protein-disulfide isomerase
MRFAIRLGLGICAITACTFAGAPSSLLAGASPMQGDAAAAVRIEIGRSPVKGSRSARVAVLEYVDFQCPFCATFVRDTLPEVESRYVKTGRVLLVFKHRPLPDIHPDAVAAATGAECAGEQGSFWPMHDLLFADQRNLSRPALVQRATRLALDPELFGRCLEDGSRRVRDDMAAADALKITGTPTFLLGTIEGGTVQVRERMAGVQPPAVFEERLERLLAQVAAGR